MQTLIQSLIRTIPDYPKPGIQFRDITTLLNDATGFAATINALATAFEHQGIDKVVGIEARGFVIGSALAYRLGVGFVPVRKAGKLPATTISQAYALEYGTDQMEMHVDAIAAGERVLLVDDLIATGGTAEAAVKLITQMKAELLACAFVIDLPALGGRQRLQQMGVETFALCQFMGE